jgi:hypothetical protein
LQQDRFTFVPVNVERVVAQLGLGPEEAHAEVEFVSGPEAGFAVFDLRQRVSAILVDGQAVEVDRFPFFDPGPGYESRMRALTIELEPCTRHVLALDYEKRPYKACCASFMSYAPASS